MCAPQLTTSEETWRTAGAVWWYRATLELRRTRKNIARIPLWGNSGSCNTRASGAASEKWRWAEQPKEIPEKNARKKTSSRHALRLNEAERERARQDETCCGSIKECGSRLRAELQGTLSKASLAGLADNPFGMRKPSERLLIMDFGCWGRGREASYRV
ncbi:hypothetical protein NDU88_003637 [Pleurodeles waltl]|uniref:Uncharacterized protein n=1 Tax=Pleurodeles waltl TaxID=8319 RepID=A0AAV7T615_PLEWA|nr:hypothetical protein NDU88_003637 [Pleurodeles waltl]